MIPAIVSDIAFTPRVQNRLEECIAHGIEDANEVARHFGITAAALAALVEEPEFVTRILERRANWLSPDRASDRIRQKADVVLEESIQHIHGVIINPNIAAADRIKAVQTVKQITTLEQQRDEAAKSGATLGGGTHIGNTFVFNVLDEDPRGRTVLAHIGNRGFAEAIEDATAIG